MRVRVAHLQLSGEVEPELLDVLQLAAQQLLQLLPLGRLALALSHALLQLTTPALELLHQYNTYEYPYI